MIAATCKGKPKFYLCLGKIATKRGEKGILFFLAYWFMLQVFFVVSIYLLFLVNAHPKGLVASYTIKTNNLKIA